MYYKDTSFLAEILYVFKAEITNFAQPNNIYKIMTKVSTYEIDIVKAQTSVKFMM